MTTNRLASWPGPEKALKALLDALDITKAVRSQLYPETTTLAAETKDYERFLAGDFSGTEKGDNLIVDTLDAILRTLSGCCLDDVPGLVDSIADIDGRYRILRQRVPVMWASQTAINWFVLSRLVIPWIAAVAASCALRGISLDAGMPGGRFWFLPDRADGRIVYPLNNVFEWWCDLTGALSRNALAERLEDAVGRSGKSRLADEIAEWVSAKADLPSTERIGVLAKAAATIGRADDCAILDVDGPIDLQLANCVDFALGRRLTPEALSKEIPTPADQIAKIFEAVRHSRKPRVDQATCERFIAYMRQRWAVPTEAEMRSRLTIARAIQKLFSGWKRQFGEEKALGLCGQFHIAYNVFMHLLPMEPKEGASALNKITGSPDAASLLGVLLPPGDGGFIDRAIAYVTGGSDRYRFDPVLTPDATIEQKAFFLVRQVLFQIVDTAGELQLPPPRFAIQSVADVNRAEVALYGDQVQMLFEVLTARDQDTLWDRYENLPADLPASAINVLIAKRIVDNVEDLEDFPEWHERFLIAMRRAQAPELGPHLEVQGLALEAWWLTALHRPKQAGDIGRLNTLFRRIDELDKDLNGWFCYELAWRRGRFFAQLGRLRDAVRCYELVLSEGTSNISRDLPEIAIEALGVSDAAGRDGRFKRVLTAAQRYAADLDLLSEEGLRLLVRNTYNSEFVHPYPRARGSTTART